MPEISESEIKTRFEPFEKQMQDAGINDIAIEAFRHYYYQLLSGGAGFISRSEIDPVDDVPDVEKLTDYSEPGKKAIKKAVLIKLNGGLGTGMGMEKAKSLLEVKNGLSFLDIIARQVLNDRRTFRCDLPQILMNSFNTREDSLAALEKYPELKSSIPLAFLQNKVPNKWRW